MQRYVSKASLHIFTAILLSGCTSFIANSEQYRLALKKLPVCMEQRGGMCPTESESERSQGWLHAQEPDNTFFEINSDHFFLGWEFIQSTNEQGFDHAVASSRLSPETATVLAGIVRRIDTGAASSFVDTMSSDGLNASIQNVRGLLTQDCNVQRFRALSLHTAGLEHGQVVSSMCNKGMGEDDPSFIFRRNSLTKTFRNIENAIANEDFAIAQVHLVGTLIAEPGNNQTVSLLEEVSLIREYFAEYFRRGDFFLVRFDPTNLEAKVKEKIDAWFKKKYPSWFAYIGQDCSQLGADQQKCKIANSIHKNVLDGAIAGVKRIYAGLDPDGDGNYDLIGKLVDTSFTTRAGAEFSVPDFTVTLDPVADNKVDSSEVDFVAVGADLVRVFTEALGDQKFGVPADPASTLCQLEPSTCYTAENNSDVESDTFTKINERSDTVATAIQVGVGRLIRGVSWFSLGNESLATMIETFVGGAVRKTTEKALWCLEVCRDTMEGDNDVVSFRVGIDS